MSSVQWLQIEAALIPRKECGLLWKNVNRFSIRGVEGSPLAGELAVVYVHQVIVFLR